MQRRVGRTPAGSRRRQGRWWVVALLLMPVLQGAVAQQPEPPDGTAIRDRVTMAVVNVNFRVALEELAKQYEALHPGIDVRMTMVGSNYETWIRTRFAAGGDLVPDIFNINYIAGIAEQGRVIFFDDYIEQVSPYTGKPWRDSFDMNLLERYQFAGHMTLIPIDYVDSGIFYNKDIFRKLGLREPETWEEMEAACERLLQAGYIPMAAGGDSYAFWIGTVGMLVMLMGDVYMRDIIPAVASQPGDWDYSAERNAGFRYDPTDPFADLRVVINQERILNAVRNGTIDFRSERFRALYTKFKEFSRYWQPGFMGSDVNSATQLFYRQKAAMCVLGSTSVTGILRDFEELDPDQRFEFGAFFFPPIADDPLALGPFRGIGGVATMLGVVKKDDLEHERRVVDFLMFLTSPESGRHLVETTLRERQPLNGPIVIKGVELPAELAKQYAPFMNHGFSRIEFRGLLDEQESLAEWVAAAQEYFGDRLSLDDFLEQYQQSQLRAIPRLQKQRGFDLDPATKDAPRLPTAQDRRAQKMEQFWNPFVNGTLALLLIIGGFVAFGVYHVARARGINRRRALTAYLLLAPSFLLLGSFSYFPAFSGLYYAFTDWEEGFAPVFVGLRNFGRLLSDHVFWLGTGNMAILLLTGLFKATVVPFLAAELILALASPRMKYFFRSAFLVPLVVPGMVGILLWRFIYEPNIGLLNQGLEALGLEGFTRSWLGEPHLALPAIVFIGFPWVGAIGLLIYLAGLMNVPQSVYEAYRLESDNVWKRLWSVDAPLVRGQTRLLVILTFIGSIQEFQGILIMTGGGPGLSTTVPALRMFYQAFKFSHFGYGAALGFVLFLVILAITIINLKVLRPAEELE